MLIRSLVLLLLSGVTACTSALFQPLERHLYTPGVVDVSYDDIYLESDPNLKLHGWKLKSDMQSKGTVLFLHGNGENISTHFANIYWLLDQGYDCYIFDYRGYGKSEGVAEIDGVMRDVHAMIRYSAEHTADDKDFIIIGHSMGGSMAIHAVATSPWKERVTTLVTVEAFSDYREITRDVLSTSWLTWWIQWPASLTINNSYSPIDIIDQVSPVPLLIMHSRHDQMIGLHHAERLFAAAREPKYLELIEGGHNNVFDIPDNRKRLLKYLNNMTMLFGEQIEAIP